MFRSSLAVLFLVIDAHELLAQTPDDLTFHLRLVKDPPQYTSSEPIQFEVSFSSTAEKKYFGRWNSLVPFAGGVTVHLDPAVNAVDLFSNLDYFGSLLGSGGYLTSTPHTESGDLTEWYGFRKPGHFRLSVSVDWFLRIKSADEDGGKERVSVESNDVEFDILPADAAVQQQQLTSIVSQIDDAKDPAAQAAAMHRLDLMQTSAATDEKLRRYLACTEPDCSPFYWMIMRAVDAQRIIPELRAALTDPAVNPPDNLIKLLVTLETRDEKQHLDPIKLKTHYIELLLSTANKRPDPERLHTTFQSWWSLEASTNSETRERVLAELLSSSKDLSPIEQYQFLTNEWDKHPHADLLPIVQRLATGAAGAGTLNNEAFKYWCQDWPEDCSRAILAGAVRNESSLTWSTALLLHEAEHPELDTELRERLGDPQRLGTSAKAWLTGAIILRAGSRNLQAAVERYLDRASSFVPRDCQLDGYLLGYLFRFDAKSASARLNARLQTGKSQFCGQGLLNSLGEATNVQPAVPAVVAALNSPISETAESAVFFLGAHGPDSVRPMLLQRLQSLREQWRDRRADVVSDDIPFGPPPGDRGAWQAAQLEKALVSALVRAKVWSLTAEEKNDLERGCLTDECHQIVRGKMQLGGY